MYYLNLQLFGEGAESGASTGAEGASATEVTSESGTEVTTENNETAAENRDEQYAKFKEEYKNEFQKDFNSVFGKRFKGMKETEERLKSYDEDLEPLYKQYNVNNPKDLANAFLSNPENFYTVAAENGTTPEEESAKARLKAVNDKIEREENAKRLAAENAKKQEATRQLVERWSAESAEVKKLHPEFNMNECLRNPLFQQGLRLGMPMINLYRALNFDNVAKDIEERAKKVAIEEAKKGTSRPYEVGTDVTRSVSADLDVNSLTDEEIDNILERVRKGEKINFAA